MKQLIFDRWTLQFQNVQIEKLYKDELNKTRLLILRVMTFCISIVTLVCLIVFVAQVQSIFLVYEMSITFGFCFLTLIFSRKLVPYFDFVFSLLYALFLLTGVLINLSGIYVPHYVNGHSTCLLLMTTLQQCPNHIKVLYIIVTPAFILGIFGAYDLNFLQYLLLTLSGTILFSLYTHKVEFAQKLAFSLELIVQKQREFIHNFMTEALLAVSLNERTNQLELEFQNKRNEDLFNITDSDVMKQFLRNAYVISNSEGYRLDIQQSKRNFTKSITLEDYLYQKLKEKEKCVIHENCNNKITMMLEKNNNELKQYEVQIEKLFYGNKTVIAIIQSNNIPELQGKYENQFKIFNKAVVTLLSSIAESQQIVYTEIKDLSFNITQQQIKSIQCSTYSIINKIKNFLVFFQQERIPFLKQFIDQCQFSVIIATVQPFFTSKSIHHSKLFQLSSSIQSELELKINMRLLIQITINCFEQALNQSTFKSTIILMISQEQTLDPLKQKGDTVIEFENSRNSELFQSQNPQKLIKFSFIYHSSFQVQLEPENEKIDNHNLSQLNNLDLQINFPVSCILLGIIGPYNRIFTKQVALNNSQYLNTINFYIYSDQSLLDQSYTRNIKQKANFNF